MAKIVVFAMANVFGCQSGSSCEVEENDPEVQRAFALDFLRRYVDGEPVAPLPAKPSPCGCGGA